MSYDSPIEIVKKMQEQYETDVVNNVLKCVQSYGINVDKDELIKALKYDREQYDKGYKDGVKEFVGWQAKQYEDLYHRYEEEIKEEKDHDDYIWLVGKKAGIGEIRQSLKTAVEKFLEERN